MRVVGIDPAAAGMTGYAVVECAGRGCVPLHFGALRPARNGRGRRGGPNFAEQLCAVHKLIERLVTEYGADAVAIEGVFSARNVKTALKLSEVRGVVQLAAAQAGVPSFTYSPREVKSRITGYGHADKHQVQQMVRALLHLRELPHPADAADALAVALCHIQSVEGQARIAAATAPRPLEGQTPSTRARAARIQFLP